MDFDPSEFLAMAMSEDENAVYTAPDLPQPIPPMVEFPSNTMVVEGGLQMEQDIQIPVPTFETLDIHNQLLSKQTTSLSVDVDPPTTFASAGLEKITGTTPQPSPADRTASPHCTKKPIPASYDESRFRKEFYNGDYERVKLFRLHCTICDQHLGCAPWLTERQMRTHKLLRVAVCRKCFDFYGDINFPLEDGSEIYCCWCGEGGEVFCCSSCPKIVCKKCIKRNFGTDKLKEIDENDNWCCYVCKPADIWPHRTLLWGLQRLGKEMRVKVASLPKEEKQARLSKDTSHCCPKMNEKFPAINLPMKSVMSKIPICLIAITHKIDVITQQATNSPYPAPKMSTPLLNMRQHLTNRMATPSPPSATNHFIRGPVASRTPQHSGRKMIIVSRPAPSQLSPYFQTSTPINRRHPVRTAPQQNITPECIDLEDDSPSPTHVTRTPVNDISWLDNGVKHVKDTLLPVQNMVNQFSSISKDLKMDFNKLTSYSDKLSYSIKIAICNLAKINQDLIDGSKECLDKQVSSVVSDIQINNVSNTSGAVQVTRLKKVRETENETVTSTTPQSVSDPAGPKVASPPTTDDDIGDLTPALLCEAVLEVEGNKENENRNKRSTPPVKRNVAFKRSGPFSKTKALPAKNSSQTKIDVINLIDEEEESKFDDAFYCKKFNIKPCKVLIYKYRLRSKGKP
uniref:PHD-type domain-containing protein n=1 Tax=Homalodisca liturata TaxID=320908 RepID=A0A1B6JDM0_9HEMI